MLTVLGERMRELREKKKDYVYNNSSVKSAMSQDDLAQELGITRLSVLNYEKGTRTPDAETLIKIAEFFNVSTDYLLGRTDIPSPRLDDIAVHALTGLSEAAIEALTSCYKSEKANYITLTINALLEERFTLGAIARYLYFSFDREENEGNNLPYYSIYRYQRNCANPEEIVWGEDAPTPFGPLRMMEVMNEKKHKRVALLEVQEKLEDLLVTESKIDRLSSMIQD